MSKSLLWPALRIDDRQRMPASLRYERAVWGKVHGAPTDFRWIACSPDFGAGRQGLPRQLNLGAENVTVRFQAWRNLGDRCYAMNVYPSKARDAAGRSGFLEKNILEWRRPPDVPAAVGALLLLPHVARMTDEIWWDRYAGELSSDPDAYLPILAADHEPFPFDEEQLAMTIERGRRALRESLGSSALELLYEQLLSGGGPAYLTGLRQPLPAEALAALLLPLPRDLADGVSVAGWVPTSRPAFDDLADRWDIFVTAPDQIVRVPPLPRPEARHMTERLLPMEPQSHEQATITGGRSIQIPAQAVATPRAPAIDGRLRPALVLDLARPDVESGRIMEQLWEFARSADRRWLDPSTLMHASGRIPRFKPHDGAARLLFEWVGQVRDQRPSHANEKQWEVKVDLLRSAAVVLVPDPATLNIVALPAWESRIPVLMFGLILEKTQHWDRLWDLGPEALGQALMQSARCRGSKSSIGLELRQRLQTWQELTHRDEVENLIAQAFQPDPR